MGLMTNTIKVSVVIATYNRPMPLIRCLEKLESQNLAKEDFEVIIINNNSTADYQALTDFLGKTDLKVKVLTMKENLGPGPARNQGVKQAAGPIVAFTDDDCLPPQNWLTEILKGFNDNSIGGVGGYYQAESKNWLVKWENFNEQKYIRELKPYFSTKRDESPFQTGNMAYLKTAFEKAGGFDTKIPAFASGEDGDLKEKVLKLGYKILFIPVAMKMESNLSLAKFSRQQKVRGAGILYFLKSRNQPIQTQAEIIIRVLLTPVAFIKNILSIGFTLGFVETLSYWYRNLGKLQYYSYITERNDDKK